MRRFSFIAKVPAVVVFVLVSLLTINDVSAGDTCAPILHAAQVARQDFSLKLAGFPEETEFDRFFENIDNYDIGVSEDSDSFVVVFKLRKKGNSVVKGGGAMYKVRK